MIILNEKQKVTATAIMIILFITVPLTLAALSSQQNVHFAGTGQYPNSATPTPSPTTPPQTAQFSLFFSNGSVMPTTLTDFSIPVLDRAPGALGNFVFIVRNDGNVPITMSIATANVNVPSNVNLQASALGANNATSSTVINGITVPTVQPAESVIYQCGIGMFVSQYTPGASFSYSFDIVVTANQA